MGGRSGGSSGPSEQTVYSQSLPEYVEPYFRRMLGRAEAESLQQYQPYQGQRLAFFSPDELAAQSMTRGYAQAGTPKELNLASAGIQGLPTTIESSYTAPTTPIASDYAAGSRQSGYTADVPTSPFQPINFEQNLQRFMSPYQQNVIDIQKREATRQSEMMADQIGDRAAQAGGLGGYREAILQAERERNLGQQLDDIQAQGSQRAFDTALRQLGAERAADLSAAQLGFQYEGLGEQAAQRQEQLANQAFLASEQAAQQAARLGLSADQIQEAAEQAQARFGLQADDLTQRFGIARSQQLGRLGDAIQQDAQQRIAALSGIGSQQRALQQASFDTGYEDFLRQQQFPQQQLGFFSNILQGVPITPSRTVSTFSQQPGLFQQALGLGLGGLGLYKGFGGGGR